MSVIIVVAKRHRIIILKIVIVINEKRVLVLVDFVIDGCFWDILIRPEIHGLPVSYGKEMPEAPFEIKLLRYIESYSAIKVVNILVDGSRNGFGVFSELGMFDIAV